MLVYGDLRAALSLCADLNHFKVPCAILLVVNGYLQLCSGDKPDIKDFQNLVRVNITEENIQELCSQRVPQHEGLVYFHFASMLLDAAEHALGERQTNVPGVWLGSPLGPCTHSQRGAVHAEAGDPLEATIIAALDAVVRAASCCVVAGRVRSPTIHAVRATPQNDAIHDAPVFPSLFPLKASSSAEYMRTRGGSSPPVLGAAGTGDEKTGTPAAKYVADPASASAEEDVQLEAPRTKSRSLFGRVVPNRSRAILDRVSRIIKAFGAYAKVYQHAQSMVNLLQGTQIPRSVRVRFAC
jgi:hypothetical protein